MRYWLRIFAIILCLSSAGCRRNSPLSDAIRQQVQSGAIGLDMSSITSFAWENVFVFGPYTPKDDECRILKHTESQCLSEDLREVGAKESLMVFLHGASVDRVE